MAIGPIGNAIYVNQQMASVASVANAHSNRVDFQNMAAQVAIQEKEAKVLEVRPAEANHEVDPDREHQQNEADQESARNKKQEKSEKDEEEEKEFHPYHLDIKV
ncbi:hypothetical protein HUE87_00455 [Candidatus Sulfurimonas marisnigri]|uniref:Uncharacterized protein n=1 Tax=Candidatus Sulfurimonas marisnigri TaxID=2740405 RepID=A0A7S7M0M9_9BACT|nr:hypothetical protein [Candidatus Sulfurimonas marisnigri]QOY54755.1 hypothetical protein HUE87_00455 [Candidatus Sulfurimonas marisnigri]